MYQYTFRGKTISGAGAWVLLKAIKTVQEEAPNPTPEDIKALEEIAEDFMEKFGEDLRQANEDVSYIQETREWLGDE